MNVYFRIKINHDKWLACDAAIIDFFGEYCWFKAFCMVSYDFYKILIAYENRKVYIQVCIYT